jgi:hypothetical protein
MKIFVFVVLFFCSLFGFTKSADYDVEYGWFKELGDAKAQLVVEGKNYHIRIEANTMGLAKFLSRGRAEVYESYGIVTPNGYLPQKFTQYKKWSDKAERTTYIFDHAAKKVIKAKEKYEDGRLIDKNEEINKYYADNDILTLYFNISDDFRTMKAGSQKVYYAVGANPKDGRVDLIIPSGAKLGEIKETFEGVKASSYVIVYINQKIFSSERGELWIAFNEKNDCERATLKDVILFGDVRGILKK